MSKGLINEILNNIADLTNLQTGEVEIDIGEIVTSGVLTSSGQYLAWTIPLGRVLPKGTTITKVLGNIVVRAANHNAAGVYIWKQNSTERVPFNTLENSIFIDGAGATQTILPSFWRLTIQGESNLLLEVTGNTSYFFPGNATNNGYLNNQPCVVDLLGVKITVDIPTNSIYVPNSTLVVDNPQTTIINNNPTTIPGIIQMYAGQIAPTGYLICDGSEISRSEYDILFAIIGTIYGLGNGVTTFNLPDLRGRVPLGAGTGTAVDATTHTLGDLNGAETHTLTVDELPSHNHGTVYSASVSVKKNISWLGSTGDKIGYSVVNTGGDSAHNNMQPYLAINYIIATGKND